MPDVNNTTKTCPRCLVNKERADFNLAKDKKDGLQSHCKLCLKEKRAANADKINAYLAAYRETRREEARETTKKWREENPERALAAAKSYRSRHKQSQSASRKSWVESNRENIRAAAKKTYDRALEKYQAKKRCHYHANKEIYRAHERNRRAVEMAAVGSHTAEQIIKMIASQEGLCASPICRLPLITKGPGKFHADHMHPLIRGGSNDISNIQLLCPRCNKSKGKKTMEEYLNVNR
jgi:5-methylcytosine-specific restriction endonuclease McrA